MRPNPTLITILRFRLLTLHQKMSSTDTIFKPGFTQRDSLDREKLVFHKTFYTTLNS